MIKILEEINAKYKGFKITGFIEYNDVSKETTCHLTATKEGFEDIRKNGVAYPRVFNLVKESIDETLAIKIIKEKAKAFILMPLANEDITVGGVELFTKTKDGWVSVENPNEIVTEAGKAWEIFGHLWIPIPTTQKTLTNKQEKQLIKLQSGLVDMCVDYVRSKAEEILKEEQS